MCHMCKVTQQRKQDALKLEEKDARRSIDSRCAAILAADNARLRLSQKRSSSRATSMVEPIEKELRIKIQRIDDGSSDSVHNRIVTAAPEQSVPYVAKVEPEHSKSSAQLCAEDSNSAAIQAYAGEYAEDSNSSVLPAAEAVKEEEKEDEASQASSINCEENVRNEVSTVSDDCSNHELAREIVLAGESELGFDEESQHYPVEPKSATNVIDVEEDCEPKIAMIQRETVEKKQEETEEEHNIVNRMENDSVVMEIDDVTENVDGVECIDIVEQEEKIGSDDIVETDTMATARDSRHKAAAINVENSNIEQTKCTSEIDKNRNDRDHGSMDITEFIESKATCESDIATANAGISENIADENIQDSDPEIDEGKTNDDEYHSIKNPFDVLIEAASILNPRQFELPRQMNIFPQFPGDEKSNCPLATRFAFCSEFCGSCSIILTINVIYFQ